MIHIFPKIFKIKSLQFYIKCQVGFQNIQYLHYIYKSNITKVVTKLCKLNNVKFGLMEDSIDINNIVNLYICHW
jgi:hypothetical protein